MATVREIAALAGVSPATVSRALRKDTRISPETRQKVLDAANSLRQSSDDSRTPVRGYKGEIELVLFGISVTVPEHEYFSEIYRAAQETLAEQGYHLRSVGANSRDEAPALCSRLLADSNVSGYLLGWGMIPQALLRELRSRDIPFVVLGTDMPGTATHLVGFDEYGGAYAAAKHLLAQGRKRFAFVAGMLSNAACCRKMEGVHAALDEAGLAWPEARITEARWSVEGGYQAMRRLAAQNPPDAILTSNDNMALGVIRAAQDLGLRIPEDISVIGFDDATFAGFTAPALTTVRTPRAELGRVAADLLMQAMRKKLACNTKLIFNTELVVRESCGALLKKSAG